MGEIAKLITELGSFGLLLGLSGWIIYNYFKDNSPKHGKQQDEKIKNMINEAIGDLKETLNISIDKINNRVAGLEQIVTDLRTRPCIGDPDKPSHPKQFLDRLKLGPQLHKTLNHFRNRINADHIFIGSFHNGNESITGIPYYKFDIIAERFRPDKVERDIEFAFMYKDADLLRHDLLPSEVVQSGTVHYIIDENGKSMLSDIDDIIYRRMVGRDIKQLAISLLRDPSSGTPSGFVGCVRYDYDNLDLNELRDCASELENVYEINEKLINSKITE
jgi:hypothetical protein